MATSIKMSIGSANLGSVIQGNSGTYSVASDGTFSADTRDVASLLAVGCVYIQAVTKLYGQTPAVATATVGKFVASTALANGSFTVAAQPDVPRQAQVIVGAGRPQSVPARFHCFTLPMMAAPRPMSFCL